MLNKYTRYDPTEMKMHTINCALPVLDFHTCTVPRNIQDEILFRKLPLHQVHINLKIYIGLVQNVFCKLQYLPVVSCVWTKQLPYTLQDITGTHVHCFVILYKSHKILIHRYKNLVNKNGQ